MCNCEKIKELVLHLRKTASSSFDDAMEFTVDWIDENKINFDIDWSDAPDNATQACVFVQYYDENKVSLKCRNVLGNFERQNIIKAGQTWKNKYGESVIIAVNDKQVVRKDQNGGFMINSIDEIILNFDLVS
jgi:hypothetical protein